MRGSYILPLVTAYPWSIWGNTKGVTLVRFLSFKDNISFRLSYVLEKGGNHPCIRVSSFWALP